MNGDGDPHEAGVVMGMVLAMGRKPLPSGFLDTGAEKFAIWISI